MKRRKASSSGDHDDLVPLCLLERKSLQRTPDFDGISDAFGMQPPADFAPRIFLYPEFDIALLVEAVQRRVWPLDLDVVVFDEYGPDRFERACGRASVAG